jgi:hypothetical protein
MTRRSVAYTVLRENANEWISGNTLVAAGAGYRFGGRIEELRKAGHTIESRPDPTHKSAVWEYRLVLADQQDLGLVA